MDNRNILLACALAGWQTLETWLGKTTRVRAGSVPEAIYNGVKSLLVKKETIEREEFEAIFANETPAGHTPTERPLAKK